jgi:hypothetical protein
MDVACPVVRYLIVCEDIQTDAATPRKVTLVNLISAIRSKDDPPFPLLYRELCVFVQLTECRGAGQITITIANDLSGDIAYPGPTVPCPPRCRKIPWKWWACAFESAMSSSKNQDFTWSNSGTMGQSWPNNHCS